LGGSDKFKEGIYQVETQTLQIVEKSFENKGKLLRKLRNILGEDEFFGEEPSEEIPPGREGMRKDERKIALMRAKHQAEIQSTQD
jgi:hypothetical protein